MYRAKNLPIGSSHLSSFPASKARYSLVLCKQRLAYCCYSCFNSATRWCSDHLSHGPTYKQASTFPVSRAVSIAVNAFWCFALIRQVVVLKVSQLCSPLLGGWKIFVTSAVGRLNRYCLPFAGSSFYHFSFPLLLSFLVWSDETGWWAYRSVVYRNLQWIPFRS